MAILWGLLGFTITIGILVTIHEWGHFAVARFFNVKILRFSLGFGKPFLSWTGKKDGTKYTLAPIPLGGFVQMYGETDNKDIPPEERHRTFAAKPAWQRFLIAFAGPFVNLVFAVLAFALLFMNGVNGVRPEILYITPDSMAAKAGLQVGDILTQINGTNVVLSTDADVALSTAPHKPITIEYLRKGQPHQTTLNFSHLKAGDELNISQVTGMMLVDHRYPAWIGKVMPDSPAEKIGLKPKDKILAINQEKIPEESGVYVVASILKNLANQAISLTVLRDNQSITLEGSLGERALKNHQMIGYLGVQWAYEPPSQAFFDQYGVIQKYSLFPALAKGIEKTGYYVKLTFNMFARLIKREVSIDNMGGPLTIGDAAGQTLRIGGEVFLNFLGIVSLSLAAINLLPIPMLDGGHMLFCILEMIRRKPLGKTAEKWSYRIGASIVLTFMGFVILKDLWRYLL